MADVLEQYVSKKADVNPKIYVFKSTNPEFKGFLKVGYTTQKVDERLKQIYPLKMPRDELYEIVWSESALKEDGTSFLDTAVHAILELKGFSAINKSEWFKCSLDDVKSAILAVKKGDLNVENRINTFKMRPEQKVAVEVTKKYFELEKDKDHLKFLWNAKMRFGKTFTAYQLAKEMNMKRILILTFKPAVQSSWEENLNTHVDFEGWQYYSKKRASKINITPEKLDHTRPIVVFGSFQDFLGTNSSGGIKVKNKWVHNTNWDMVIFDEYHYGAWRDNAKSLFVAEDEDSYDTLDLEKYKEDEADNAYNETFIPIKAKRYLYLSGTPFRALNTGEFIENQIFSWTYSDEQKAKLEWKGSEENPYKALPKMLMFTYKMPSSIKEIALKGEFDEFDLNLFFEAKPKDDDSLENSEFKYKEYVQKWLDLIRGAYAPTTIDNLKLGQGKKPAMPYSDIRLLNLLNHTLWFLPSVASCYAMKNLLKERQNIFYSDYNINVAAGPKAGIGVDALYPVIESMNPALNTKSITLSCGKLTTGVTVKPWTGIFMLRNLSTPETYFQAAFRVQSPWEIEVEHNKTDILKKECFIFDFALDRALRQVSDYSNRLNVNSSNPEKKVEEFIKFLPVIAYDGATMQEVSAKDILDITTAGTSATLLARRWESALLVNVDNETLMKLINNEKALQALMNIEGFRSLNKDITTIINKSDKVKRARTTDSLQTEEKKRELTNDEKEYRTKRKEIQEKLIKFATRIPIFIYLTEFREYSLKDVITKLEPELFKKVTGLNIEDFELLISIGLFNEALMNEAVYKFKIYEDSSLKYAGINKRNDLEDVGLFSTAISREEYLELLKAQQESMTKSYNSISFKKPFMDSIHKVKKIQTQEFIEEDNLDDEIVEVNLKVGMNVEHLKFGEGIIIEEIDDDLIKVKFKDGSKVLSVKVAFSKGLLKLT